MDLLNLVSFYLILGCCIVQSTNLREEEEDSPALNLLRRLVMEVTKEKKATGSCPTPEAFKKLLKDKDVDKIPDKVCGDGECSFAEDPLKDTYGVSWYCVCKDGDAGTFCQYKSPCKLNPCPSGDHCFPLKSGLLKYRNTGHICFEYKRALRALEQLDEQ